MHKQPLSDAQNKWHATTKSYGIGFILSLALTLTAFLFVGKEILSKELSLYLIIALALLQAFVQLVFFFHLTKNDKKDWQTLIFIAMLSVLLIIVIGSLWIMHDLDKRAMPPMTMIITKGKS